VDLVSALVNLEDVLFALCRLLLVSSFVVLKEAIHLFYLDPQPFACLVIDNGLMTL